MSPLSWKQVRYLSRFCFLHQILVDVQLLLYGYIENAMKLWKLSLFKIKPPRRYMHSRPDEPDTEKNRMKNSRTLELTSIGRFIRNLYFSSLHNNIKHKTVVHDM